jgi:hypothetical protein
VVAHAARDPRALPVPAFLQLGARLPILPRAISTRSRATRGASCTRRSSGSVAARRERRAWPPAGDEADVAEAHATAEVVFARFEAEGRTGDPAVWAARREAVLSRLARVVQAEGRDHDGLAPALLEHRFGGRSGRAPLEVRGDGETVLLQGRIDRVDASGERLLVIDYKNARDAKPYAELLEPDAMGVTSFQVPAYLAAARELPGRGRLEAAYALLRKAARTEPFATEPGDPLLALDAPQPESGDDATSAPAPGPRGFAAGVVDGVRRIREGDFPIAPRACVGCPSGAVCRVEGAPSRRTTRRSRMTASGRIVFGETATALFRLDVRPRCRPGRGPARRPRSSSCARGSSPARRSAHRAPPPRSRRSRSPRRPRRSSPGGCAARSRSERARRGPPARVRPTRRPGSSGCTRSTGSRPARSTGSAGGSCASTLPRRGSTPSSWSRTRSAPRPGSPRRRARRDDRRARRGPAGGTIARVRARRGRRAGGSPARWRTSSGRARPAATPARRWRAGPAGGGRRGPRTARRGGGGGRLAGAQAATAGARDLVEAIRRALDVLALADRLGPIDAAGLGRLLALGGATRGKRLGKSDGRLREQKEALVAAADELGPLAAEGLADDAKAELCRLVADAEARYAARSAPPAPWTSMTSSSSRATSSAATRRSGQSSGRATGRCSWTSTRT